MKVSGPQSKKQKDNFSRMLFLKKFINAQNLSYETVGNILGLSKAMVSFALNMGDDMRMSQIIKVIESQGYTLNVLLTREDDEMQEEFVNINDLVVDDNRKLVLPPLYYLTAAMTRYGVSRVELAKRMGVIVSSVRYWLAIKKDLPLSRLFHIAKAMDLNVRFKIEPSKKLTQIKSAPGKRSFIVQMEMYQANEDINAQSSSSLDEEDLEAIKKADKQAKKKAKANKAKPAEEKEK